MPVVVGLGVRQTLSGQRAICDGAAERLAGTWEIRGADQPEGPRQAQIHAAFLHTGKSYAADVYETVSRALTGYAQNWANMYKATCEATSIHHDQSPEVLDLRMSCLQERLAGFHALTDVFAEATGEVVEKAVSASNALATLDRCADVPTLRAVVRPPDDPTTVGHVADLRGRLAATKARFDAGRWKEASKDAPVLVSEARAVGYLPLLAEALRLEGIIVSMENNGRAAETVLIEAYRLADASRHDEIRAEVAVLLVFAAGYQERHFEDAVKWYETASSVIQRLGGHELLRAWLLNDIGCAYAVHRDPEASVAALKEGLALKQKLLGWDHADVGLSEGNLSSVLVGVGRNEEALVHVERAIAIEEKVLGPQHPALALQLSNRGEILNGLKRYQEARRSFQRAISIWERELGPEASTLAAALTGIGISYLGEQRPAAALEPLERAIKLRIGRDSDPVEQADTSFALARALWDSNRELSRARSLADEARTAYDKSALGDKVVAVDRWLQSHGSS
jgi:tetratricopeptide (TPR) repeat protein